MKADLRDHFSKSTSHKAYTAKSLILPAVMEQHYQLDGIED